MKQFFKKYTIAVLALFALLGAGIYYVVDEFIFDDRPIHITGNQSKLIGENKVKQIVEDAVGQSDLTYAYINLEMDDGLQIYDVKASHDNKVYDLDINAVSGQVISFEEESISNSQSIQSGTSKSSSSAGAPAAKISEDKVKEIVEKATGKSNLTYTELRLKQDDDYNGRLIYDVTAYADGTEYDYDIDADSGEILSQSSEPAND